VLLVSTITIERKLEVLGNNKLLVPGCEPTSAVTSVTLMAYQRREGTCKNAVVSLQDALDAIPGSRLEFGTNFNAPRKRWFVLPPFDPSACPCVGETDWYGVLRSLATEEVPVTDRYDYCNTINQGFCPSPDFKTARPGGEYGRAQDGGAPVPSYFGESDDSIFQHYTTGAE
jgi:hypothetical protein